jgi:hypothetical protein
VEAERSIKNAAVDKQFFLGNPAGFYFMKPSQNKDFGSKSPAKTQQDKKAEPSFNPQVPRRKCPWGAYSSMSRT